MCAVAIECLALTPAEDRFTLSVPPMRRLFGVPIPFQSTGQAFSAFASVVAGAIIVMALVWMIGGALDEAALWFVTIGAIAGGSPFVSMTRRTVLTIQTNPQGARYWRQRVHERLEFHGYQLVEAYGSDKRRYRTRLPRWLRWQANEFVLSSADMESRPNLIVTGPWFINKLLLKALRQPTNRT